MNFEVAEVQGGGSVKPEAMRHIGMCLGGRWYAIKVKEGTYPPDDPVKGLDVQVSRYVQCPGVLDGLKK